MKTINIPTKSPGDQVTSDEFNLLTEAVDNTVEYLNGLNTSQVKHDDTQLDVHIGKLQDQIDKCAGKNDLGVLATGEEQRLVVEFVNIDGKRVEINIPGVYYNGSTKKIETYEQKGQGMMSIVQCVLAENPSANVVYCDKMTNKLYRWNGSAMVQVGGGGGSVDAYTKEESDAKFAKKDEVRVPCDFELTEGQYYDNRDKVVGDTASLIPVSLSSAKSALIPTTSGEELTLTTVGTRFVVAWIFIDADNKIVSRCADGEVHCSGTKVVVPEGATKLIFNCVTTLEPNPSVSGLEPIKDKVHELDNRVTELEKGGGGDKHEDVAIEKAINRRNYIYNTRDNKTIGQPAQTVATQSSNVHCMSVELEGVKKVNIRTSGLNYNSLPYYFVDKDDILLAIGTENINLNETIDVPEGAVRLYVNYTYVSYPVANPGVTLYYDYNYYVLNHIKADKPLAGKKVVMLGDSIHEFTLDGIGIVEHFAELSGATVYRCAVGGGHLTRRSADVGYDVPDVVDALTSEEGLARLEQALTTAYEGKKKYIYDIVASIDIMDVDYVTVLAGTNDWASGNPAVVLGTDDDTTEVNNISGAVRYIIDTLLAKNPKLQIKFFTPTPRAYNADLANFSDTYIPYSGGYLLPDLCKRVMSVCKNSHVPCCDMYWGLGWNKDNLLTFAGGDGVHPYQGFDVMAEHELAFVVGQDKNPGSSGIEIVQDTGDSTTAVMSQKAVTDALASAGGGEKPWEFIEEVDITEPVAYYYKRLAKSYQEVLFLWTRSASQLEKDDGSDGSDNLAFVPNESSYAYTRCLFSGKSAQKAYKRMGWWWCKVLYDGSMLSMSNLVDISGGNTFEHYARTGKDYISSILIAPKSSSWRLSVQTFRIYAR